MIGALRPRRKVTEPDTAVLLVLVHGPPGSGKTTTASRLAAELGLPLFAKDEIKERLYGTLGTGDADWSRRLGTAVYSVLFLIARRELEAGRSLILEANFVAGAAEEEIAALPPHRLVQIHCHAPEDVLMARYHARERHPGHLDAARADEVLANIRAGRHRPLATTGTLLELDTTQPLDPRTLAARIRAG